MQVRIMRGALLGQAVPQAHETSSADHYTLPTSVKYSQGVLAVYEACRRGMKTGVVTRGHLVDARTDGGLLLELYSRDGIGTMISTDFYEGIRRAGPSDVAGIKVCSPGIEGIRSVCSAGNL
jgi:amino-acid N-acetyltransferase